MRLRAIIIAFAAIFWFAGCTTFSLSSSDIIVQNNDTSPSGKFVHQANAFQNQFSKAGWLREEEQQSRVRSFLSILNKGWSRPKAGKDASSEQTKDAVSLYLSHQSAKAGDDTAVLALRIQDDLDEALTAMTVLNAIATPLLAPNTRLQPKILRNDVMVLERALLSARKAQSLFAGAIERTTAALEPPLRDALAVRLNTNAKEIVRMKMLADTLNALRLKTQPVG